MAVNCPKPLKACALRITALSDCYVPVDTTAVPNSQIVLRDFVSLSFSPEIETGTEFTQRNACDQLCISEKGCDIVKYWNLTLELCGLQPHVEELLGISTALVDAQGNIVGSSGIDTSKNSGGSGACSSNVALEVWMNNSSTDRCATTNACPYIRFIFPLANSFVPNGDTAFTNDIFNLSFSGTAYANGSFDSPVGLANDPDLTFELVEAIRNGDGRNWICTDTLPDVIACDYANPA